MTLRVDFNMADDEGRVVALVEPHQRGLVRAGETVVAEDFEGNRCKATVAKLVEGPPTVAHLVLVPGTSEPAPDPPHLR
ncbi:MAG TPA: hypothetical protein VHN37_13070 [Actinomycetota bacterium]|nr:hypothetical protein [Actinomycetota bacterium]